MTARGGGLSVQQHSDLFKSKIIQCLLYQLLKKIVVIPKEGRQTLDFLGQLNNLDQQNYNSFTEKGRKNITHPL